MPQDNFIVVPNGGQNVLWLEGVKGKVSFTHDAKISVRLVDKSNADKIAESIIKFHSNGNGKTIMSDHQKQLWTRLVSLNDQNPGQTLAITGKAPGWGKLTVTGGDGKAYRTEVGVSKQRYFDVAFRFLRHKEPDGTLVADTIHKPAIASDWIATLNWIYGPQANVMFDLLNAEWVTLDSKPSQPISRDFFKKSIANTPVANADITIYLVGQWGGGSAGHSRGTYFDNEGYAVVTDSPKQDEIPEGIDVFMLTMAHEILHYLREKRKLPPGHYDRDGILLSNKVQSLRLDKQAVLDVNPPG